jgi:pimeloyl-ACP methyl ester carboxylesterase
MIAYLHGMPGSPAELALFGDSASSVFSIPNRFDCERRGDRYDALAHAISEHDPGCRIRLVAFSLGTRPALEVAARLGSRVASVDLIAPAAPLAALDRGMAGYPVFVMARDHPVLFGVLTRLQAMMARVAPSILCAGLFRTASGADLALSLDPGFRARMADMLAHCFGDGGRTYRDEIDAFVTPWSPLLATVAQPVTLWHGTLDNWAPIAMSEHLFELLPNVVALNRLEGLSHYSSLRAALKMIAADVALSEAANRA